MAASSFSSSYSPNDLKLLDDFYLSVLSDSEEDETLMSSSISPQLPLFYSEQGNNTYRGFPRISKLLMCRICTDLKDEKEMFDKNKCGHLFCLDCVSRHIGAKFLQNPSSITCPDIDCNQVFQPEDCRYLIPDDVFKRWMDALCESFTLGFQKYYCPYKDCSAMLVDDGDVVVRECECPHCRRLFCAQCKVSWHFDISCEDFQKLNVNERGRDDRMVLELAKKKKWARCPSCKFYIEKNDGCQHITCRCGFQFCYGCGITWGSNHGGCQRV